MTGMLASVNSLDEALQVLSVGVDIIDLKQPAQGALGALALNTVTSIVKGIDGQRPVSATIGDLPMHPEKVLVAAQAMATTGVDYVKIGFFPGGNWQHTIEKLAPLACNNCRLIAVLFADQNPDFDWVLNLAKHGFAGVMLDTMNKQQGSLTSVLAAQAIADFVELAQNQQMLCGLAGSLNLDDIERLLPYQPDYLGFRGALCKAGNRVSTLDTDAVKIVKQTLYLAQSHLCEV